MDETEGAALLAALPEPVRALAKAFLRAVVVEVAAELDRQPELEPLLDTKEVMHLMGCSEPKVKAMVAAGMPVIPSGGQDRFERSAVLQWLREGHGKGVVTVVKATKGKGRAA